MKDRGREESQAQEGLSVGLASLENNLVVQVTELIWLKCTAGLCQYPRGLDLKTGWGIGGS